MEKQITISEQEIPTLIEYLRNRIESTRAQLISLEKTLNNLVHLSGNTYKTQIQTSISLSKESINNSYDKPLEHEDGYNSAWTWIRKIIHILKAQKESTTSDIVNAVLRYEPDRVKERKKVMASVSAVLSTKSKDDGLFKKRINMRNDNVYSLTEEGNRYDYEDLT